MTIKIGDVVELKSGSPQMTVESIKDGVADCVRFDGNTKINESFAIATIQILPKVNLEQVKKIIKNI